MENEVDKTIRNKIESIDHAPMPHSTWDKANTWTKIKGNKARIIPLWFRYAAAVALLLIIIYCIPIKYYYQQADDLAQANALIEELKQNNAALLMKMDQNEERLLALENNKAITKEVAPESKPTTKVIYNTLHDTIIIRDTIVKVIYEHPVIEEPETQTIDLAGNELKDPEQEQIQSQVQSKDEKTHVSINAPDRKMDFSFMKSTRAANSNSMKEKKLLCLKLVK